MGSPVFPVFVLPMRSVWYWGKCMERRNPIMMASMCKMGLRCYKVEPSMTLRIDTSGWGVHFDALFDKVRRSCSLRDYYILYIIR